MRKIAIPAAAAALALGLGACATDPASGSSGDKAGTTPVVGATAVPAGEVLAYIQKDLAAGAGWRWIPRTC